MFSPATHNKTNAKSSNSNLFQKEQGEGAFIQAKLKVGKPGDKYEVEADNVAEKVVEGNQSNGPENKSSFFSPAATPTIQKQEDTEVQEKSIAETITPTVQLAPAEEEIQKMEEENVQSKEEEEESIQAKEDEEIQAKLNIPKKTKTNLSSRIQSAKGKGSSMPADLKTNMESGFGADFSGVKIHTGSESAAMNKDLGAKAFTNKNDIFFNEGKFNPQSKDGQTLIAHELTHTIQQGASKPLEVGKEGMKSAKSVVDTKGKVETVKEGPEQATEKTDPKAVEGKAKEGGEVKKEESKKGEEAKGKEKGKGKKGAVPVTTTPRNPKDDPNFKKLEGRVDKTAKGQQDHEDSKVSAGAAQSAAVSPDNERESMAQSGQVEAMDAAEPGAFSAEDFKAKLMERIEGMQLPKNQDEAANFEDNNNIDEVNSAASGDVEGEKAAAAGPVEQTAKQEPNVAAIPEREVKPLPEAPIGKKPPTTNPTKAMPPKRGNAEVNKPLQDNMSEVDQQMAENEVTDEQLAKSNEPSFKEGLDAKGKAKENTESAPGELRKKEQGVLQSTKAGAKGKEQTGLAGMHQDRAKLLKQVTGSQTKTGTTDTSERTRIATEINKIYEKSKTDVEKILSDLDTRVKTLFTAGTFLAKRKFEQHVDAKMSAYKSRRYSGVLGAGRWLKDKFAGMPDEVNDFFVTGRQVYIDEMDKVITIVANLVATKLTEAKTRVATGKQEVQDYVKSLPENLQKIGKEAAEEINDKFDELEDSVNSKQDELIDSLAEQYMEGLNAVDARIEEMKAANRGLIDAALGFINGIIETIKKLKELITTLLAEIQNAIGVIMEDPIGFVSTLFEGVGKGIDMFMANIQKHMLGGFVTWLTGAMGPVGITIPDNLFSLKGIFSLVMQILGLSWDFMRKKAVLLMGEPMVSAMEKGFEMFQIIREKGVAGMWEHMKEQFTDLKETIIDSIKQMLITQVIEAGIKWLLSLLIPGAGFIKAIMAIKDLIVFFVESAIMLIPSLIEAIRALASGNVGGVSKAIEKGLAMLLPLVIGLFAKLIGLGGLVKKVQKIIKKVRKRIDRAVTKLIKKAKKKFKSLVKKGKAKVKGAVAKVLSWWKRKENFKDEKGKSHKLFYKGKGKKAELTVASNPISISKLIQGIGSKEKTKKQKTHYNNIVKLNKEIEAIENSIESIKDNKKKQKKYDELASKMKKATKALTHLMPLIESDEIPNAVLPAFVNGVKGKSFEALYISKDPNKTPEGEPAEKNNGGTLPGWKPLQGFIDQNAKNKKTKEVEPASIRKRDNFVKMHLLHDRLGGKAFDSNLSPAKSTVNNKFKDDMETAAVKHVYKENKVIWYKVTIKYHQKDAGENDRIDYSNYPSQVDAKYGFMEKKEGGNTYEKKPAQAKKFNSGKIKIPQFGDSSEKIFSLRDDGWRTFQALEHTDSPDFTISKLTAKLIANAKIVKRKTVPFIDFPDFLGKVASTYKASVAFRERKIATLTPGSDEHTVAAKDLELLKSDYPKTVKLFTDAFKDGKLIVK